MRGAFSVLLVLSLGAAITMYQMAGVGAALGLGGPDDYRTDDELQSQAGDLNPNGTNGDPALEGSASQQEGSIVGLIINGASAVFTFLGAVILLPLEMNNLGFPWWFAFPVGLILQIHAGITGVQFTVNRVVR